MADKIRIEAGSKKVGDQINGKTISGLGKIWSEKVRDDTACAYGMQPGLDYYPTLKFQYAYFN